DDRCPVDPCQECDPLLLPHPDDCAMFYKCTHGYACEMRCPSGLHWSSAMNRCEWPKLGDCALGAHPTKPNSRSNSRCPQRFDPNHPVLLPHSRDCTKYYVCVGTNAVEKQCPNGQHWSLQNSWCDFPQRAKCIAM
ncbi:AAEL009543-PA, partial [Aedes aegypti]